MTVPTVEVRSRTRPGRPFLPVRERELDDTVRALASRLPGADRGLVLGAEFVGPVGVVDLLAVTRVGDGYMRRAQLAVPYLTTEPDATIVASTYASTTRTIEAIAHELGSSIASTTRRLRVLETKGAVRRFGGGFRRSPELQPVGRAYAIEAKVSDWRRGLTQALKYSSWCDAAGVVLLESPSSLELAKDRYRNVGIGLAVGERWLVRPRIVKPNAGRRLVLSERVGAALAEDARSL